LKWKSNVEFSSRSSWAAGFGLKRGTLQASAPQGQWPQKQLTFLGGIQPFSYLFAQSLLHLTLLKSFSSLRGMAICCCERIERLRVLHVFFWPRSPALNVRTTTCCNPPILFPSLDQCADNQKHTVQSDLKIATLECEIFHIGATRFPWS